mmetsp:Transcript_33948/g.112340  ORF Transcript_33948/g.112340 Transcript_33948/m.112340 type:complete len:310 (+) Transcript_33948:346-1275(+)
MEAHLNPGVVVRHGVDLVAGGEGQVDGDVDVDEAVRQHQPLKHAEHRRGRGTQPHGEAHGRRVALLVRRHVDRRVEPRHVHVTNPLPVVEDVHLDLIEGEGDVERVGALDVAVVVQVAAARERVGVLERVDVKLDALEDAGRLVVGEQPRQSGSDRDATECLVVERLGAREEDALQRDLLALDVVAEQRAEPLQVLVGDCELAAERQVGHTRRQVDVAVRPNHRKPQARGRRDAELQLAERRKVKRGGVVDFDVYLEDEWQRAGSARELARLPVAEREMHDPNVQPRRSLHRDLPLEHGADRQRKGGHS